MRTTFKPLQRKRQTLKLGRVEKELGKIVTIPEDKIDEVWDKAKEEMDKDESYFLGEEKENKEEYINSIEQSLFNLSENINNSMIENSIKDSSIIENKNINNNFSIITKDISNEDLFNNSSFLNDNEFKFFDNDKSFQVNNTYIESLNDSILTNNNEYKEEDNNNDYSGENNNDYSEDNNNEYSEDNNNDYSEEDTKEDINNNKEDNNNTKEEDTKKDINNNNNKNTKKDKNNKEYINNKDNNNKEYINNNNNKKIKRKINTKEDIIYNNISLSSAKNKLIPLLLSEEVETGIIELDSGSKLVNENVEHNIFIYILKGRIEYKSNNEIKNIKRDAIFIIKKGISYEIKAEINTKMLVVYIL